MTPEDGLLDLEAVRGRELQSGWEFIRKLAAYVDEWGPWYYGQVAEHLGRPGPKTLQNYVSLARNPISHYAEKLGLSRADASAVLGLPEEEARALLLKAAEEGLADDWLRFEARAKRLPPTGSSTSSLTKEAQPMDVRTYEGQTTLTAIDDGGTKHRANGVDPHYGVTVAEAAWDESEYSYEVPFCLPPDPIDAAAEDDTAFDVAERVVAKWGVLFAKQVAEEIERWGEWQDVTATVHER